MSGSHSRRRSGADKAVRSGNRIAARFYRVIVAVLISIRFYHARNVRYASIIRTLAGPPLRGPRTVVDLGCGTGGITSRLRNVDLLIGVDHDRTKLSQFDEPSIPRIQAHAECLPFKNGRLDVIVAISLVEHFADQPALFRELARVLRTGGCVVLQVPELRFPLEPHTKWPLLLVWNPSLQARILQATGYRDLNLSTSLQGIVKLATAFGFHVGQTVPVWHFRAARVLLMPMGYFLLLKKG